ncbi:hypothetical protein ABNK63_00915 [Rhodanobacter sp. IGA1.0]|uniref:Ribbon-helix-helix protein CopG domain-containing protein n=1 Tax=Rhodanobacter sp. IGA1.0 TaxID=3158582 RepID=A0AAU7QKY0_9GAMM
MTSDARFVIISGQESLSDLHEMLLDVDRHLKLSRFALVTLLRRYLEDHISAEGVVDLMEALEMNERVNVDTPRDVGINDVLFELANPEINGDLTKAKALSLIKTLSSKGDGG